MSVEAAREIVHEALTLHVLDREPGLTPEQIVERVNELSREERWQIVDEYLESRA